ncbi:MAG: hypothetical protein K5925_02490 [Bacilli bacterium]|nr:hypothetical protein [Bacilli bacterium]
MMKRIEKILKNKELDGYVIRESKKEIYQLYFVKDKVETARSGKFVDTFVTIYVKHDEKLGDATFQIYQSSTENEISQAIDNARNNALSVFNPPYDLVKKETFAGENEEKSLKNMADEIANAIFSTKANAGAKLNATEIFVNKIETHIINSNGLDKKSYAYKCMIETIPTFDKENESVEIYAQTNFSEYTKEDISNYIAQKLFEVEARAKAEKIELPEKMDVTLRGEEIENILQEYIQQLNYFNLAMHSNAINVGDNLQNGNGDKITLTMKNKIVGCADSADFDSDGSSFKEKVIIENGVAKDQFGGNRFAQYVNKENTGALPLCEINCGDLTKNELENATYLECLQFSGIQCDFLNDYLGGEVRLAILHKDGKQIPVCGFSISGKLSELMGEVKLSKGREKLPGYSGPAFIYLKDLQVL